MDAISPAAAAAHHAPFTCVNFSKIRTEDFGCEFTSEAEEEVR